MHAYIKVRLANMSHSPRELPLMLLLAPLLLVRSRLPARLLRAGLQRCQLRLCPVLQAGHAWTSMHRMASVHVMYSSGAVVETRVTCTRCHARCMRAAHHRWGRMERMHCKACMATGACQGCASAARARWHAARRGRACIFLRATSNATIWPISRCCRRFMTSRRLASRSTMSGPPAPWPAGRRPPVLALPGVLPRSSSATTCCRSSTSAASRSCSHCVVHVEQSPETL